MFLACVLYADTSSYQELDVFEERNALAVAKIKVNLV